MISCRLNVTNFKRKKENDIKTNKNTTKIDKLNITSIIINYNDGNNSYNNRNNDDDAYKNTNNINSNDEDNYISSIDLILS